MAVTINWQTGVISILQADLTPISGDLYELDTNWFRLQLKDLEDDEAGIPFPKTHNHNTVVLLGGIEYARIIEILSPYTVTFQDGQYAVNLVGSNNNIADVTNVNQVSVRPSNSAGLIQTREIQYASFEGGVFIDPVDGTPGTIYPAGTPRQPVDNLTDALFIADLYGFTVLHLRGALTVAAAEDVSNFRIKGWGAMLHTSLTSIVLDADCVTDQTSYYDLKVDGSQNGESYYFDCVIGVLADAHCQMIRCGLKGPITINSAVSSFHTWSVHDCYSGTQEVTININGSPIRQDWTNFEGKVKFTNGTHASGLLRLHMSSGTITLDSTCTAGTYVITGECNVVDNSTGSASVDTSGVVATDKLLTTAKYIGLR